MNVHELPITTWLVCGLGAWGCYLLLTQRKPAPRRTGTAVATIALAAVLALFPLPGGDALLAPRASFFATISFLVPAGCGLAATIALLACRSRRGGLAWFAAVVLANSALLFAGGAVIAGAMNLIVNLGFVTSLLLFAALPVTTDASSPPEPVSDFTWLACAVAGLILAGLLSALPFARVVAEEQTIVVAPSGEFGWRDLGRSLLFDHGISLTVVSLLLFVAVVIATRMTAGESSESSPQPVEGAMA